MTLSNVFVPDWPRRLAVWLALTTLVPMVAYSGAAALFAPPDEEAYNNTRNSLNEQLGTASAADKPSVQVKLDQSDKVHLDLEHSFARRLFWVSYGVGCLAVAIGLFMPVQTVGAGLMFGGIIAIVDGCYYTWDSLGRGSRFGSLVVALLILLILSLVRFRPSRSRQ
jgi:hypothetical protein